MTAKRLNPKSKLGILDMPSPAHSQASNFDFILLRRFRDPKLQALFSFQDLYVGLSPYNAPGVFSLLPATEITDGVHYAIGGFQKVRDGLQNVAQVRQLARVNDTVLNSDYFKQCWTEWVTKGRDGLKSVA